MKLLSICLYLCCNTMLVLAQKSNTTVNTATNKATPKTNVPIIKDGPKTNVPVITDADGDLLPIKPTPTKPNGTKTNVPIIKDGPKTNVPVITDADGDLLPIKPTPTKPNGTKTNVPIIKDGPKTNVPVITDADGDLLPIQPNKPKPVKKGTTNVPVLTDADELLAVKSNEPNPNDLLDITVPYTKPTLPNAGTNVFDKLILTSNYSFNKKMGFTVISDDGTLQGDFYLNTKTGYSLLPNKSLQNMAKADGQVDQIMGPKAEFYQYIKSSEGNFCMQMDNPSSYVMLTEESKNSSKQFFNSFKRTNIKTNLGGRKQFKCVVYTGKDDDGHAIDVYLASAGDIKIDIKKTYAVTGHFGLGYIAAPSGNTYLIAGIVSKTGSIFLNYIENESAQFSGTGYKPVGQQLATALKANEVDKENAFDMESINNETDPQLKAAKIKAAEAAQQLQQKNTSATETFIKTSDFNSLPGVNKVHDIKATEDYYNFMILALEEKAAENNKRLKALQQEAGNNKQAIKDLICMNGCNNAEIKRYQKLKEQHIGILKQYNIDRNEDKRDAAVDKLMQQNVQPTLCNCK